MTTDRMFEHKRDFLCVGAVNYHRLSKDWHKCSENTNYKLELDWDITTGVKNKSNKVHKQGSLKLRPLYNDFELQPFSNLIIWSAQPALMHPNKN